DAARQTLEAGLKGVPGSVPLTLALFDLELRAGRVERSIEILRQGLEVNPNQAELGLALAMILAERGATGELFLQINKLESIGINPILIKYLKSYYYVNRKEFTQALPLLTQLQVEVGRGPDLKARIYLLLARCYGPLKQPEQEQFAYEQALVSSPRDLRAQLGLIDGMVARGETDRAIEAYRRLIDGTPEARIALAPLLIAKNRQLPAARRNWGEVDTLLAAAAARAAPESLRPVLLQVEALADRGEQAKARDLLATARTRFPNAVEPWVAEADLRVRQ